MKKFYLLIIVILFSGGLSAQKFDASVIINTFNTAKVPRTGEEVILTNQTTKENYSCVTNDSGTCKVTVPQGATYTIGYRTWGDDKEYAEYPIPEMNGHLNLTINIEVQDVPVVITLKNVLFETGKSDLKSSSFVELDKLYNYLKNKKDLKIEISGFTDNVGDESSNIKLSDARANSVKTYLVKKGIATSRMMAKGFGEANPVASNDTDAGRKLNRRTEVRFIGQ